MMEKCRDNYTKVYKSKKKKNVMTYSNTINYKVSLDNFFLWPF